MGGGCHWKEKVRAGRRAGARGRSGPGRRREPLIPREKRQGRHDHGFRWMDPATGRSPGRDPVGGDGGWTLCGSVSNGAVGIADQRVRVSPAALARGPCSVNLLIRHRAGRTRQTDSHSCLRAWSVHRGKRSGYDGTEGRGINARASALESNFEDRQEEGLSVPGIPPANHPGNDPDRHAEFSTRS